MADQRYIDFIEAIIDRTKNKQLDWYYLDKNESLYKGMEWTKTTTEYGLFSLNGKEKTVADFLFEIRKDGMRAVMEKYFL